MINLVDKKVKLIRKRINNIYIIHLDLEIIIGISCLASLNEDTWI